MNFSFLINFKKYNQRSFSFVRNFCTKNISDKETLKNELQSILRSRAPFDKVENLIMKFNSMNIDEKKTFFKNLEKIFSLDIRNQSKQKMDLELKYSDIWYKILNFHVTGTTQLLEIRKDLLSFPVQKIPQLDKSLKKTLSVWFSFGLLKLEKITASFPENFFEKNL